MRAGKDYAEAYPDETPWSFSWSNSEGTRLGGALSLENFREQLAAIEAAILRAEDG